MHRPQSIRNALASAVAGRASLKTGARGASRMRARAISVPLADVPRRARKASAGAAIAFGGSANPFVT
jgi:hypothetical protein